MELLTDISALFSTRLAVTTAGYAVSFISALGVGLFILVRGSFKAVHIAFILFNISVAVYAAMFILGTIIPDASLSKTIWLATANDVFIAALFLHWVLALVGKTSSRTLVLFGVYALGIALFVLSFLFPDALIPMVEPKMYFNNYPVAGPLYSAIFAYFALVVVYAFLELAHSYLVANTEMRNRLKYIFLGSFIGYSTGTTAFLLSYDIQFDPVLSMFLGVYSFLYAYAVIRHRVMNVRIAIKRAVLSAVAIGGASWLLFAVGAANTALTNAVPAVPRWAVPLAGGIAASLVGFWAWRKATEAERVKREFLTVAAHKLRTPLSRMRYAAATLRERFGEPGETLSIAENDAMLVRRISDDVAHMTELTDILLKVAEVGDKKERSRTPTDIREAARSVLDAYRYQFKNADITLTENIPDAVPRVLASQGRVRTVLRILLNNALVYTPSGGEVSLSLLPAEDEVVCEIEDTGIGIAREDISHIFSKFFRTEQAKRIDTEGLGLGLFLAKDIIEQYGGRMWVRSAGEGEGSRFSFSLPIAKDK